MSLHHVEHGDGVPLVALHGAGVDHRELEAALEPLLPPGLRRVYPDLPGFGRSPADGLDGNDDVVDAVASFVEEVVGAPALVLGHSYGAYLARGLAARYAHLVRGLALVAPVGDGAAGDDVPPHAAVQDDPDAREELTPDLVAGYEAYFVVRTRATAARYRDAVVPGTTLADEAALERIFAHWTVDVGDAPCEVPALLLAGRDDAIAGWRHTVGLLDRHPRAALTVLDGAGHALLHERPEVVGPLLADWVERVTSARTSGGAGGPR